MEKKITTTTVTTVTTEIIEGTQAAATEIICILDRSGSMDDVVDDTIGGYNSFIEEQKQDSSEAYVTLVLFDTTYEVLYDRMPLCEVPKLTRHEYRAMGGTALLDAVGTTITRLNSRLTDPTTKVIMMIMTDGGENSSREYDGDAIKKLVAGFEENKNHVVVYLGSKLDYETRFTQGTYLWSDPSTHAHANIDFSDIGTYSAMSTMVTGVRGATGSKGAQDVVNRDTVPDDLRDLNGTANS